MLLQSLEDLKFNILKENIITAISVHAIVKSLVRHQMFRLRKKKVQWALCLIFFKNRSEFRTKHKTATVCVVSDILMS